MSATETVVLNHIKVDTQSNKKNHPFFASEDLRTRSGNPWPTPPGDSITIFDDEDKEQSEKSEGKTKCRCSIS